jgi:hypothetical protein
MCLQALKRVAHIKPSFGLLLVLVHLGCEAVDLLEIWADADPHFDRYAEYYGAAAEGQEPYHLLRKFLLPVLDEWAETMWGELRTDREYHVAVLSLSDMLQREYMRQRPDWGLSTLIERAASLPEQAAGGSRKRKGAPQLHRPSRRARRRQILGLTRAARRDRALGGWRRGGVPTYRERQSRLGTLTGHGPTIGGHRCTFSRGSL